MSDEPSMQQDSVSLLHNVDSDQLLSAMTLADREKRYDDFAEYRREIMFRLRCAEPLLNWNKPMRMDKNS